MKKQKGEREKCVWGQKPKPTEKYLLVEYLALKFLSVGKRILKPSIGFTGFSSHKEELILV